MKDECACCCVRGQYLYWQQPASQQYCFNRRQTNNSPLFKAQRDKNDADDPFARPYLVLYQIFGQIIIEWCDNWTNTPVREDEDTNISFSEFAHVDAVISNYNISLRISGMNEYSTYVYYINN